VQVSQQKIGHLRGQNARALEHVVKMRLKMPVWRARPLSVNSPRSTRAWTCSINRS
jgi:hypothetical protein